MLLKRGAAEDVYAVALQRLRDTVRAGLPKSQSPGVEYSHSSVARLYADARDSPRFTFRRGYALITGRCPMRVFKGMSGGPTSRSTRSSVPEHGRAYQTRVSGSRSSRSTQREGCNGLTQTDRNVCRWLGDHGTSDQVRGRAGEGEQVI